MSESVQFEIERTVPTYTRLRAVSWYAFELAKLQPPARLNHLMTSMLFCAFTLEAYLNHLGSLRISFWDSLKRSLGPRDKLDVVCTDIGFSPDLGQRPFQTFTLIFKLRNLLVHAETETIVDEGEFILNPGESPPVPLTAWEELISMQAGERFRDDSKAMIMELARQAGLPPDEAFAKDQLTATKTEVADPEDASSEEPEAA